jgi:hypothetical protein
LVAGRGASDVRTLAQEEAAMEADNPVPELAALLVGEQLVGEALLERAKLGSDFPGGLA